MPKWAWGELADGGIRVCSCGVVTLEDEMHVCILGGDEVADDETPEFPDFGGMEYAGQIAKMGLTIMRGVTRDGGSPQEAFTVTAAFFAGMFAGNLTPKDENED